MSVEVEGVAIGIAVRGNGPMEEFARALEPLRTDREANHNYSVWFAGDHRVFHRLQWGGCTVVRSRDPNRFARALALHLSGHGTPPSGLVRSDGVVAVHGDNATVLPASLRQRIPVFDRRLRETGVILHDAPWVDFDPRSAEVVVESPGRSVSYFDDVLAKLPPVGRPEATAEPGRYRLAGWHFDRIALREEPMSAADAVANVLAGLRSPLTHQDQLAAVAAMFDRTPFDDLPLRTPRELLDQIRT